MKKIKCTLTVLMVLLFANLTNAQVESMRTEIQNYDITKSELILKGRKLLLKYFLDSNLVKVKSIMDFFKTEIDDTKYFSLSRQEKCLLYYWTKDYDLLLSEIQLTDSAYRSNLYGKMNPAADNLSNFVKEKSLENNEMLLKQLDNSSLIEEERDFLKLYLRSLFLNNPPILLREEAINTNAEDFINKYPQSKYGQKVTQYLKSNNDDSRYSYRQTDWAISFDMSIGQGWHTKGLTNNFTNSVLTGAGLDVYYKKYYFHFRGFLGYGRTRKDISFGSTAIWKNKSALRIYMPELTFGYMAINNPYIRVTPFLGISGTEFNPSEASLYDNPTYKDVGLKYTTTYAAGLNFDVKLGCPEIYSHQLQEGYRFLRFRFSYNAPQFEKKYTGFSGNMYFFTIGFGSHLDL